MPEANSEKGQVEKLSGFLTLISSAISIITYFLDVRAIPAILSILGFLAASVWFWNRINPPKKKPERQAGFRQSSNTPGGKPNPAESRNKRLMGFSWLIASIVILIPVWFPVIRASELWNISIEPQPQEKFVVVVAKFADDTFPIGTSKSRSAQDRLYEDLNIMISHFSLQDKIIIQKSDTIYSDKKAEEVGVSANADIVIWGNMLHKKADIMKPNFRIFGENDELAIIDPQLFNMQVTSESMLTNRARAVTFFVLGIYYLDNNTVTDFKKAKDVLSDAISETEDEYKDNKDYQRDLSYNLALLNFTHGRACAALGEDAAAIQDFQRALEYWPNYHRANVGIGNVYYSDNDLDAAKSYYQKADTVWSGVYGVGLVSYAHKDYTPALDYIQTAYEMALNENYDPDGTIIMKINYSLGMAYGMNGDLNQARMLLTDVCSSTSISKNLQELACDRLRIGFANEPVPLPTAIIMPPE